MLIVSGLEKLATSILSLIRIATISVTISVNFMYLLKLFWWDELILKLLTIFIRAIDKKNNMILFVGNFTNLCDMKVFLSGHDII